MITLEQLIKEQKLTDMSDIQVISKFFKLNDMEVEGLDLIYELTQSKIEKLKHKERIVREWISYLPSEYLYKMYDLHTADKLHTLELDYLSHGCELSKERLEWARKNVPNIEKPHVYFMPLIDWLSENGIEFKDE